MFYPKIKLLQGNLHSTRNAWRRRGICKIILISI